jgi:hypothetical protein
MNPELTANTVKKVWETPALEFISVSATETGTSPWIFEDSFGYIPSGS